MIEKIRQCIVRSSSAPRVDLEGRGFIVTGATENSLGFATAKTLLEWGGEVTLTRRSRSEQVAEALRRQCPESAHSRVLSHDLDLARADSVREFVGWYRNEKNQLDVLINNAGVHLDLLSQWKEPKRTEDGFEIHWRTNFLGTAHLTHLLLPLLLESATATGDARVVNVVSALHQKGRNREFFAPERPYDSWEAYGQSKLGLVHFTKEIHRRFSDRGLFSHCLHPGAVFTNVADKGLAGNPAIESIRRALAPVEGFFLKTPEEGAQTQILCATAPGLQSGEYYRDGKRARASSEANDSQVACRLWEEAIAWIESLGD